MTRQSAGSAVEFTSGSVEDTQAFGERLGRALRPGDVVALYGELGSGKTTLTQGIARGCGVHSSRVKSPTFVLQREYAGPVSLIHLDGYRLAGPQEAEWLGVEELFAPRKVTVIEWAERFEGLLPEDVLEVRLSHVSANRRRIALRAHGTRGQELLAKVQDTPGRQGSEATHGTAGD